MSLSNENIVLLSKYALKAKIHIWVVKIKAMFTNPRYASNILIKAGLSDNQELVDLTKMVSRELNVNLIEMAAIEAYIQYLYEKKLSINTVWDSKFYLIILAHCLYELSVDGKSYREAVEALILQTNIEEQAFCIILARKFYPFWICEHSASIKYENKDKSRPNVQENETPDRIFSDSWTTIELEFFQTASFSP